MYEEKKIGGNVGSIIGLLVIIFIVIILVMSFKKNGPRGIARAMMRPSLIAPLTNNVINPGNDIFVNQENLFNDEQHAYEMAAGRVVKNIPAS